MAQSISNLKTPRTFLDRAALRLLYDLALRCGEVFSLDVEDINLEQNTLAVIGKGHTSKQTLTIPEPTKAVLKDWIEVRGNEPGPLFTNFERAAKGKRLMGVSLWADTQRTNPKSVRTVADNS